MLPLAEWKGDPPSLDLLNRMVADELPLGLQSGPVELSFQRDTYFDSPDWTLRRRGVPFQDSTKIVHPSHDSFPIRSCRSSFAMNSAPTMVQQAPLGAHPQTQACKRYAANVNVCRAPL